MTTQSIELLESIVQGLPVASYVCASDGEVLCFNSAMADFWGREPSPLDASHRFLGPVASRSLGGQPQPPDTSCVASALRTGREQCDELSLIREDGQERAVSVRVHPICSDDRDSIRVVVVVTDITDQNATDVGHGAVAAQTSERRLSSIAATMPQALYVFNVQTLTTEYQNRILAIDLGYSAKEMETFQDNVLGELLHPDDKIRMPELLKRWDTAKDGEVFETEYRMRHRSGQWRTYLGRDTVYERDEDGRVLTIIGTSQDITERVEAENERRRLEAQVLHSQKLESLGVLAGGIAHDFNNLLTSVLNFSDLALMALPHESPAAQYIREAINGAESAAELTGQMLAYSGRGSFDLHPVNLSTMVKETSRLLHVSISKKSTLRLELSDDLPPCHGDVSQLRQVIMNLIINASEAMGDGGGVITLATGVEHIDADEANFHSTGESVPDGAYVYLEVGDDGCGMNEETRQKLFDPFFSTKFSGRGLGMSAVLGIVRGHSGAIQVSSEIGKGTTFRVLLPVADNLPSPTTTNVARDGQWHGQGKILLADDDASVLRSTRQLLNHLGFDVVAVTNGLKAVQAFRSAPDQYDWVILDLTMPQMDGIQACQEIHRIRGDVNVILMSGFNEESTGDRFSQCKIHGFLKKPFQLGLLKDLLRDHASG